MKFDPTNTGTATVLSSRGVNQAAFPGIGFGRVGTFIVTVPAPPSTNNLFATVRGRRVKSKQYRQWLERAVPLLERLAIPLPGCPCRVNFTIDGKVRRSRDGDNFAKPIFDALVAAKIIPSDNLKHIQEGWWKYRGGAGDPSVTVWLVPITEDSHES